MNVEVRFPFERFPANVTRVSRQLRVNPLVILQVRVYSESPPTRFAGKRSLQRVRTFVRTQVPLVAECLSTRTAGERSLARVDAYVTFELAANAEGLAAEDTRKDVVVDA